VLQTPSVRARPQGWSLLTLCQMLGLLLIESVNWLAFTLFWVFFAALVTDMRLEHTPVTWLRKLLSFAVHAGGGAFVKDAGGLALNSAAYIRDGGAYVQYRKHAHFGGLLPAMFRGWLLPIAACGVFLLLFASANPVIETWLASLEYWLLTLEAGLLSLDLRILNDLLAPSRVLFWLAIGVICWGALRAVTIRLPERPAKNDHTRWARLVDYLFSPGAVTRTLVLSNLLFLAQNVLDANFLWAGSALPAGISYAEYAHRGAYPLVVTALLAAAFVLIATRGAGGLKQDRLIRSLIFFWLLQNLVLVLSSIWRTNLYVAEYSLTYLRLAALLWMGLVLYGLLLIALKVVLDKSGDWLIRANLAGTFALLIATCPLDLGRFIANYNVNHSAEIRGGGYALDFDYLRRIGPSALPALLQLEGQSNRSLFTTAELRNELELQVSDWRRWTFRAHRLMQELKAAEAQKGMVQPPAVNENGAPAGVEIVK
jgi:hypothetical protein